MVAKTGDGMGVNSVTDKCHMQGIEGSAREGHSEHDQPVSMGYIHQHCDLLLRMSY